MKILNEIKFTMPSLSVNESTARAVVSSFLTQADPTVEELADIRTAVSEAVTNSVVHGYRRLKGNIEMTVRLLPEREIYIKITSILLYHKEHKRARINFKKLTKK